MKLQIRVESMSQRDCCIRWYCTVIQKNMHKHSSVSFFSAKQRVFLCCTGGNGWVFVYRLLVLCAAFLCSLFHWFPLSFIYVCLLCCLTQEPAYCFYCRMQWRVLLSPFACGSKVRMETNGPTVQWWRGCPEPGNIHPVHGSWQSILLWLETIVEWFFLKKTNR